MAATGPVEKIYSIKTIGFEQAQAEFAKMSAEFEKLKKQKKELDSVLAATTDPAKLEALNKKIQERTIAEKELSKQLKERKAELKALEELANAEANGNNTALQSYMKLIEAYKQAKEHSKAMEAQFGKESQQAIDAARSFVIYETELNKINNLKKGNIAKNIDVTPAADVPFTHNLNPDGTVIQEQLIGAKDALNDYDRAQIAATISATEFANANKVAAEQVKGEAAAVVGVVGSLDEYTGTLRQNIIAQIENNNALAANRAAQKSINDAIKETGIATDEQIARLAALKEEAIILDQTNKSLAVTIRNQAKEFIAANGSLDEGRAKINQLQQAYAQLSEAERISPFGQNIKNEIDILEPKVKELEATIGLFQRNVGNYPSTFTGAFKVLENELDVLQGKLVQGNFAGKEFDELTKKTATLNTVTQSLNTTFKTTTAEQTAYKEAARQVGATFGTESVVFQNFTKEVGASNAKLKETDLVLNKVSGSGKKAGNVFQTIFSGLRSAANILPGIGMSGLILLLLAPLEALAAKVTEYASSLDFASKKTADLKKRLEEMKTAVHESEKEFVTASTNVESLRINVDLAKQGFLNKDSVLKQYNDTLGKTYGAVKSIDEVEQILVKNGDAYVRMQLYKAAATVALENAAKKAFEAEELRRKKPEDTRTVGQQIEDVLGGIGAGAGAGRTAKVADENAKLVVQRNKETQAKLIKDTQDAQNLQLDIARKFQKDAAEIAKSTGADLLGGIDTKKVKEHADRLTVDEQNALKRIDATFKEQIAIENTRVNEIEKVRHLNLDEEITHLRRIETITQTQLNDKISLLSKHKKLNSEELAQLAEFKEKRSAIELETSKKIQDIEKKRFDEQDRTIKRDIDQVITQLQQKRDAVLNNPSASNVERARADIEFIDNSLDAYQFYYDRLSELNSNYNKEALAKAKDHIAALMRERSKGTNTDLVAEEKDLEIRNQTEITRINIQYEEIRTTILTNDKLTYEQRERQLRRLEQAHKRTILSAEVENLTKEMNAMFLLFAKGLKTEQEYIKKLEELRKKRAELEQNIKNKPKEDEADKKPFDGLEGLANEGVKKLFPKLTDAESEMAGKAIAESFDLAANAMHSYYDAEQQRIQASLDLNLQRLDMEKEQVKARATSQAEIESIEKTYEGRKKAAQKKAGEELKKSKRSEARIALATELANIWATVWQLGPIAGPILGGVFTGLAFGRYALRLGEINSQQFDLGGNVPRKGGIIQGRSHAQGGVKFNYDYEAEGKEISIIRTKNAPRNKIFEVKGTIEQIASQINVIGGGVAFSPGAKLKRFEVGGNLGNTLNAPVFVPSQGNSIINNRNGLTEEQLTKIMAKVDEGISATNNRIDRLQVHVNAREVVTKNDKYTKAANVGTL